MDLNQFIVDDSFWILGKGTVFAGRVLRGTISVGMKCANFLDREVRVTGIEVSNVGVESATSGQKVTFLSLSGAEGLELSLSPGTTLRFID